MSAGQTHKGQTASIGIADNLIKVQINAADRQDAPQDSVGVEVAWATSRQSKMVWTPTHALQSTRLFTRYKTLNRQPD